MRFGRFRGCRRTITSTPTSRIIGPDTSRSTRTYCLRGPSRSAIGFVRVSIGSTSDVITSEGAPDYTWDEAIHDFRLGALAGLCPPVHFVTEPLEPGSRSEALFSAMTQRLFSQALEIDAISALDD